MTFITVAGKEIVMHTGEKRSTSFLFQSIGIALQRGNSMNILGTLKQDDAWNEVFSL